MAKMNIDLGYSNGCEPSTPCCPDSKKVFYPSIHWTGEEDLGIPVEGVMEVKYRITNKSVNTDEDGNKKYSCSIEVQAITEAESSDEENSEPEAPATSKSKVTEDALDALMKKKMKSMMDSEKEGD